MNYSTYTKLCAFFLIFSVVQIGAMHTSNKSSARIQNQIMTFDVQETAMKQRGSYRGKTKKSNGDGVKTCAAKISDAAWDAICEDSQDENEQDLRAEKTLKRMILTSSLENCQVIESFANQDEYGDFTTLRFQRIISKIEKEGYGQELQGVIECNCIERLRISFGKKDRDVVCRPIQKNEN